MAISTQRSRGRLPTKVAPHGAEVTLYVMLSGVLGGLFMTILMAFSRLVGLSALNLERTFGSLFVSDPGPGPWLVGLVMHLAISAVFALAYAEAFRRLKLANAKVGAALGVVQWVVIGAFIGVLPSLRPVMTNVLGVPGAFAVNSGVLGFTLFLLIHLIFGAMVGVAFQRMIQEHPEVLNKA